MYLTKVRVSFVREAGGKIKIASQIVLVVDLENTTIKVERLIVKVVGMGSPVRLDSLPAKVVRLACTTIKLNENAASPVTVQMSIKIRKVKIDASSTVNLQTDLRQTNLIVGVVL